MRIDPVGLGAIGVNLGLWTIEGYGLAIAVWVGGLALTLRRSRMTSSSRYKPRSIQNQRVSGHRCLGGENLTMAMSSIGPSPDSGLSLASLWAKLDRESGLFHPLPCHLLDVSAVALAI
jgi:hypothetical protein